MLATAILAALGTILAAGDFSYSENVREHLKAAQDHLGAGRLPEAEIEFENVLAIDPDNRDACALLFDVYLRIGRLLEARRLFERAERLALGEAKLQEMRTRLEKAQKEPPPTPSPSPRVRSSVPRHATPGPGPSPSPGAAPDGLGDALELDGLDAGAGASPAAGTGSPKSSPRPTASPIPAPVPGVASSPRPSPAGGARPRSTPAGSPGPKPTPGGGQGAKAWPGGAAGQKPTPSPAGPAPP